MAENAPVHDECYWAALRSGRYVVPVNHPLSVDEVVHIVTGSGARVLVASAAMGDQAAEVLARCPGVSPALAVGGVVAGFEDDEQALAGASAVPFERPVRPVCARGAGFRWDDAGRRLTVRTGVVEGVAVARARV